MEIILDLDGWEKEVLLNSKDAIKVLESGYIRIGIIKPFNILVTDRAFVEDNPEDLLSLCFYHNGFYKNKKPIYTYKS